MTQFYIMEIKKTETGDYEHEVFWAFDEDPDKARRKGESKFHARLAEAAISDFETHSVTLISQEGFCIMNQCYYHLPEPAEPEPQDYESLNQ